MKSDQNQHQKKHQSTFRVKIGQSVWRRKPEESIQPQRCSLISDYIVTRSFLNAFFLKKNLICCLSFYPDATEIKVFQAVLTIH